MLINWPWSKTYTHKCPDGGIIIIHKNIEYALPLAIKDVNSSINTDIKAKGQAVAKLKAEYASKVTGLLYNIDEQNKSLLLSFRLSYLAFQSNPCDDKGFLKRQAELLTEGQQRLIELKMKISGLITLAETFPSEPDKILPVYNDILTQMSGINVTEAVKLALKENRESAKKWIQGGNNG